MESRRDARRRRYVGKVDAFTDARNELIVSLRDAVGATDYDLATDKAIDVAQALEALLDAKLDALIVERLLT